MTAFEWYKSLVKPEWAPPVSVFGPVWSVLYLGIFVTYGLVLLKLLKKEIPFKVALPFILNIFFNIIFTPLQIGLKNNTLASVDILLIIGTLIWAIFAIYPHKKWIAYAQIPYLLWVSFATVLQLTITYLNW